MIDAQVKAIDGTDSVFQEKTRSGQVYWIEEADAVEYFDALNTRIESFTGFSTKTAERYQIVNYGLGGHYLPHHDPFLEGTVRNTIIYLYASYHYTDGGSWRGGAPTPSCIFKQFYGTDKNKITKQNHRI